MLLVGVSVIWCVVCVSSMVLVVCLSCLMWLLMVDGVSVRCLVVGVNLWWLMILRKVCSSVMLSVVDVGLVGGFMD